jgi:hypothetical protein
MGCPCKAQPRLLLAVLRTQHLVMGTFLCFIGGSSPLDYSNYNIIIHYRVYPRNLTDSCNSFHVLIKYLSNAAVMSQVQSQVVPLEFFIHVNLPPHNDGSSMCKQKWVLGLSSGVKGGLCFLLVYCQTLPNFCNHQLHIAITVGSFDRSYIEYTRMLSPVYYYVISLVVFLSIRRGPDILMFLCGNMVLLTVFLIGQILLF